MTADQNGEVTAYRLIVSGRPQTVWLPPGLALPDACRMAAMELREPVSPPVDGEWRPISEESLSIARAAIAEIRRIAVNAVTKAESKNNAVTE